MTIFEHALIGVNGALALGLQRRHGWQVVAWAGVASVVPDLDGLTILFGSRWYAEGHRLWGHNLMVAGTAAAVLAALLYSTDGLTRLGRWVGCHWRTLSIPSTSERLGHSGRELLLWLAVGVAAAYGHLAMDVLFSIGKDMPVWGVPLLWPFSDRAFAYPLVRWGDIGATVILAASMFAMVRWPERVRAIAAGSLLGVAVYFCCGGWR